MIRPGPKSLAVLAVALAGCLGAVPGGNPVWASSPETAASLRSQVRALQQRGEFEPALVLLDSTVQSSQDSLDLLREAYLLLVESHVLYGNVFDLEGRRNTAALHWDSARDRARECLTIAELRDTDAALISDYPERGRQIFDALRREMFGAFRIARLEPADAEVRLDGTRLGLAPGDTRLGMDYLPVGEHSVLVRREGYEDVVETVQIESGSSLVKEYALEAKRGVWWYVLRGTGVVAAGTAFAWFGGAFGENPTATEEPLPGPPLPPD